MPPSPLQPTGYRYLSSVRSRVISAVMSAVLIALVILMLVQMGMIAAPGDGHRGNLVAVTISPEAQAKHPTVQKKTAAAAAAPDVPQVPTPITPPPVPVPKTPPLNLIPLTSAEFAAADISKMARHGSASSGASAGDSTSAMGPGEGPGGERLYNAEWYREPSHAELVGYYPPNLSTDVEWAEIACRTIEHYHVEDCQELGESPRGSGMARALRQAAWQFLVRPPRVGGKALIGAWVRIRFDFRRDMGN